MPDETRPAITDSPWFWLLIFSASALIALQVISRKYNQRQAQIERQHQARQNAWQRADPSLPDVPLTTYSTPDHTIVGLNPLRWVSVVLILVSCAGLLRARRTRGDSGSSPGGPMDDVVG